MRIASDPYFWFSWLRALACLSVVSYHLNQIRPIANLSEFDWDLYRFGETFTVAVSFFFILTGAGISIRYWTAFFGNETAPSAKKAFWNRLARLAPAYWVALLASFLLACFVWSVSSEWIVRLGAGIFFLSWAHPATFFPVDINGPLWYIPFDVVGSAMVFGTMYLFARTKKSRIPAYFAGIFGLLVLWHLAFSQIPFPTVPWIMSEWFPRYNPFSFGWHFMIGILAGATLVWGTRKHSKPRFLWDAVWIAIAVSLWNVLWDYRILWDFEKSWLGTPFHFPIVPLLMAWLMVCIPFTKIIAPVFELGILRLLAKISYSIYLWHAVAIFLLSNYAFPECHTVFAEWAKLAGSTLVLTIIFAWPSHVFLERRLPKHGLAKWGKGKSET